MSIGDYVTGVQHIGIPTLNMEESTRFYESLGFKLINTEVQPNGGKVAFFDLKGLVMEVYESEETTMRVGSVDHIAIDTKHIDDIYAEVQRLGLTVVSDGVQSLPFWTNGIKYLIISGPNKERIEFCQIL